MLFYGGVLVLFSLISIALIIVTEVHMFRHGREVAKWFATWTECPSCHSNSYHPAGGTNKKDKFPDVEEGCAYCHYVKQGAKPEYKQMNMERR